MTTTLGIARDVLAAEGPAAVRDRILDRVEEWRRRRAFRPARTGASFAAPVLNLLATPPARRLGGIQIQFLRRIAVEADERPVTVLYPDARGHRLEHQHRSRRHALTLPGPGGLARLSLRDADFETAVLRAADLSKATAVHVEGVAGLPLASLLEIGRRGLGLVLSLHDFALLCPRPDLLEQPVSTFCGYCRDLDRCHACLAQHWDVGADFQRRYRAAGAELLHAARAVVHPSHYLCSTYLDLVPGLDAAAHRVIAPAGPTPAAGSRPAARSVVRHVAFVGTVRVQKGALVFEDVVRMLGPRAGGGVRFSVFGGGDRQLLRRLSRLPDVSVRGYYRAGTLPRLLRRHDVDLALLLSITPESYGLTLDECREADVPVIAFDHGAVAERVRGQGGGVLVPTAAGASGVLTALRDVLAGGPPGGGPIVADPSAGVRHAALAHLRLYHELDLR